MRKKTIVAGKTGKGSITVSEAVACNGQVREFLAGLEARKYSPMTIESYGKTLKEFFGFIGSHGSGDARDVTAGEIEKFSVSLRERGLSAWTVCSATGIVKMFFRFLDEKGVIFMNPAAGIRIRTPDRRVKNVPSEDHITRLLAQPDISTLAGIRNRTFLETAYSTGARISEMTGMDVSGIDLGKRTVRVMGKGKIERMLPLTKQAAYWLDRYVGHARGGLLRADPDEPALWVDVLGHRMKKWTVSVFCRNYSISAGLPFTVRIHAIRRACATHMLRNGAHPVLIQNLLGHASSKTICHYIDATMPEIKKTHGSSAPGE